MLNKILALTFFLGCVVINGPVYSFIATTHLGPIVGRQPTDNESRQNEFRSRRQMVNEHRPWWGAPVASSKTPTIHYERRDFSSHVWSPTWSMKRHGKTSPDLAKRLKDNKQDIMIPYPGVYLKK